MSNNWFMEETKDYLRHVGALDESSAVRGAPGDHPELRAGPVRLLRGLRLLFDLLSEGARGAARHD